MEDPYNYVRDQLEATLQTAAGLHSSYKRILATVPSTSQSSSEELAWAKDELNGVLLALEGDLEELELSVDTVKSDPARFGIDSAEIRQRLAFVARVKDEINSMRRTLASSGPTNQSSKRANGTASTSRYRDSSPSYRPSPCEDGDDPIPTTYEGQQQQFLYENQNTLLEGIGGTVSNLRQQATLMGREVFDQVGLLNDLESGVENSQSRLERANKRMNEFIRKNKNSASSWTILLLMVVLSALLFAIIVI